MTWILTIVILLLLLLCWLLFSPLLLEFDTASATARFSWRGIAEGSAWFDGEFWVYFRIFFFHKKIKLNGGGRKERGGNTVRRREKTARGKDSKGRIPFTKLANCLKTFRIKEWKLALDTGDYTLNARLYPLNFLPSLKGHLEVNFMDRNYFSIKIYNAPWKILYAFLR